MMLDIISQYHLAWFVYLVSGGTFCRFVWHFIGFLNHSGWRDLILSINLVTLYTPWYVNEASDYIAPAIIVVVMDLLLDRTENGLAALLAILAFNAVVLSLLLLKRALHGNHDY